MKDLEERFMEGWLNTVAETETLIEEVQDLSESGSGPKAAGQNLCDRWRELAEKLLPILEARQKGPVMGNVMMEGTALVAQMHALLPEMNDYINAYTKRPSPAGRPRRVDPDDIEV